MLRVLSNRLASPGVLNRLALAIGGLSLFISLGGESFAAKKVASVFKTGAVSSRVIHDNTIQSKDLTPALRAQLAKAATPGPKGDVGPPGPPGSGTDIPDGAITTARLADGSVTNPKLALGAVNSVSLLDGSVDTADLAPNSVTAAKIPTDAVGATEIANDSIDGGEIVNNSIGSGEIMDNSLGSSDLAGSAVGNTEIATGAVSNTKLGSNAVDGPKVANNSLTTADIAGADVNGATITVPAAAIADGRCHAYNVAVGGASVGEAVVFSVQGAVPDGVLIYGQSVLSDDVVATDVCNFTGGAMPAINNLPVRVVTFG